ncbi:MAG TPA: hypothetical protein VKD21_04790 [Acidimicrobiales bacterium]|nr:hypothetical protein [Acidimicrobiales bacterium]
MFDRFQETGSASSATTAVPGAVNHMLDSWADRDAFPPEVRAEYIAKFGDPGTVHAICEEYRASSTLDRHHDEADRGRRRIACPTLVL